MDWKDVLLILYMSGVVSCFVLLYQGMFRGKSHFSPDLPTRSDVAKAAVICFVPVFNLVPIIMFLSTETIRWLSKPAFKRGRP